MLWPYILRAVVSSVGRPHARRVWFSLTRARTHVPRSLSPAPIAFAEYNNDYDRPLHAADPLLVAVCLCFHHGAGITSVISRLGQLDWDASSGTLDQKSATLYSKLLDTPSRAWFPYLAHGLTAVAAPAANTLERMLDADGAPSDAASPAGGSCSVSWLRSWAACERSVAKHRKPLFASSEMAPQVLAYLTQPDAVASVLSHSFAALQAQLSSQASRDGRSSLDNLTERIRGAISALRGALPEGTGPPAAPPLPPQPLCNWLRVLRDGSARSHASLPCMVSNYQLKTCDGGAAPSLKVPRDSLAACCPGVDGDDSVSADGDGNVEIRSDAVFVLDAASPAYDATRNRKVYVNTATGLLTGVTVCDRLVALPATLTAVQDAYLAASALEHADDLHSSAAPAERDARIKLARETALMSDACARFVHWGLPTVCSLPHLVQVLLSVERASLCLGVDAADERIAAAYTEVAARDTAAAGRADCVALLPALGSVLHLVSPAYDKDGRLLATGCIDLISSHAVNAKAREARRFLAGRALPRPSGGAVASALPAAGAIYEDRSYALVYRHHNCSLLFFSGADHSCDACSSWFNNTLRGKGTAASFASGGAGGATPASTPEQLLERADLTSLRRRAGLKSQVAELTAEQREKIALLSEDAHGTTGLRYSALSYAELLQLAKSQAELTRHLQGKLATYEARMRDAQSRLEFCCGPDLADDGNGVVLGEYDSRRVAAALTDPSMQAWWEAPQRAFRPEAVAFLASQRKWLFIKRLAMPQDRARAKKGIRWPTFVIKMALHWATLSKKLYDEVRGCF